VFTFIGLAMVAGFWGPFNSMLIKHIIDILPQVQGGDLSILITPITLIVINFIVFDNITWRSVDYINYKLQLKIKTAIIEKVFQQVIGNSHQFFQERLSGKIADHITTLADNVEIILNKNSHNIIRNASLGVIAIISAGFVNLYFCYIFLIWFSVFSLLGVTISSRHLVKLSNTYAEKESNVAGELVDSIANNSNIKIFSNTRHELVRLRAALQQAHVAFHKIESFRIPLLIVEGGSIAIMLAFVVYFLAKLYALDLVTIGDFALILGLAIELGHITWNTLENVDNCNQAIGKCKQSLDSLLIDYNVQDKPNASILKVAGGQITFKSVKFHYKGTEPLFHNKSVDIKMGQKVGLVGYSGSGKSTFVNLILRLYDVTEGGAIFIDGQDIRDVTQDSLVSAIALIPQDPSLFHRSLWDNIRYGKIDATDEEVIEAARKAHVHDFIIKLPQDYGSLVGERGVKLSGGQRQRIAIARAILKNAPILILDEATSQLDSVTESLIQESLWELMQGKTTIVIAHRLSTLLHMDRILVFDEGRIVEDGTHDELLVKEGLYKTLWDAQIGGFLGDKKRDDEQEEGL